MFLCLCMEIFKRSCGMFAVNEFIVDNILTFLQQSCQCGNKNLQQRCLQNWKSPWSPSSRCSTVTPRTADSTALNWGSWWRTSCPTSWGWEGVRERVELNTFLHDYNFELFFWCLPVSERPCCCGQDHEGPRRQRRQPSGLWGVCFSGCGTIDCLWAMLRCTNEAKEL